jgi:3-phenylpropionate/cinnamic acid dioxygenase small subunit
MDRAEIVDVTLRYCRALDARDYDALDDVFTPEARADLMEELEGREAIKVRVRRALEPLDRTQHLVGNHQVEVNGDRATCSSYLQSQHVRREAEGGPNFIVAGQYEDRLVRTQEGWRIEFRRLLVWWTEGNARVTRG